MSILHLKLQKLARSRIRSSPIRSWNFVNVLPIAGIRKYKGHYENQSASLSINIILGVNMSAVFQASIFPD